MRIVVTGATGTVGSAVVRHLLAAAGQAAGHAPVAAVRRPGASALPDGVEAVRFDFEDARTYAPALHGADGLFLMRPPAIADVKRYVNPVVDAAARAGVRRVAFLSVLGAEKNPLLPHRATEKHLEAHAEASGLDVALLRAANFMQNFAEQHAAEIRDRGEVFVPAGRGRMGYVDARDVGAVAATLLADGPRRRAYDLTGPAALDHFDVARLLSEATGRRVVYTRPGAVEFVARKVQEGAPLPFALVMAGLYSAARLGLAGRVTGTVARVLGRPPTDFATFARDYADVWTSA